jgi:hypothetical protein
VHAVSLTPHAKYDTACTIDEWFERPWQPLKGISIINVYVRELSYATTTKYINLKGLPNKKIFVHAVSLTPHALFLRPKIDRISANSKQNSKRRPWIRGPGGIVWWRNRRPKISWHSPFKQIKMTCHI